MKNDTGSKRRGYCLSPGYQVEPVSRDGNGGVAIGNRGNAL
jgi:hypothetical protein